MVNGHILLIYRNLVFFLLFKNSILIRMEVLEGALELLSLTSSDVLILSKHLNLTASMALLLPGMIGGSLCFGYLKIGMGQ